MLRDECRLRPLAEDELATVLAWRNSERIRAHMYTDHLISPAEHRAWFERLRGELPARFLIFTLRGRPLGAVSFSAPDALKGTAHWGFYIGSEDAPRGSGSALGWLALEYAFGTLGVRKLIGEAFSFNQASLAYHRRLGFAEEGPLARQVLKNGRYQEVLSFALFRDDWLKLREEQAGRCFGRKEAAP